MADYAHIRARCLECALDRFVSCRVDCLVAVGKKSSTIGTTEKFYERLRESRNNPQKMVNSPLLVADDVGDVLGEAVMRPHRLSRARSADHPFSV